MIEDFYVTNGSSQAIPAAEFTELMASVLAKGSKFRFQASGASMSPFIRNGDIITLAPAPPRIRYGEVVAFVRPESNRLVVHRIIAVSEPGYLTKGDNATEVDGNVMRSNIIGRVVRVERQGEKVRVGLGDERVLIAFLSLHGWLIPAIDTMGPLVRPIVKRFMP